MTNEELLQQAKDQVAHDMGHENWEDLVHIALSGFKTRTGAYQWIEENTWEAAEMAIQSAREEGQKEWFEKGYLSGAYRASHESWKEAYDKELTAPGR